MSLAELTLIDPVNINIHKAIENVNQAYDIGISTCEELFKQGDSLLKTELQLRSLKSDIQRSSRLLSRLERNEILFILTITPTVFHQKIISLFEQEEFFECKDISHFDQEDKRKCQLDSLLYNISLLKFMSDTMQKELIRQEKVDIHFINSLCQINDKIRSQQQRLVKLTR